MCFQVRIVNKTYEGHFYEEMFKVPFDEVKEKEVFVVLDDDGYSLLHMVKCNTRNVSACIKGTKVGLTTILRPETPAIVMGIIEDFDYVTDQEKDINYN